MTTETYRSKRRNWWTLVATTSGQDRTPVETDIVQEEITRLVHYLYNPDPEHGWVLNRRRMRRAGAFDEGRAPSWIRCTHVTQRSDGRFVAFIRGANPGSLNLKKWIEGWTRDWGWNVEVRVYVTKRPVSKG